MNDETAHARRERLQRAVLELNDTSPECLVAVGELKIMELEETNAALRAQLIAGPDKVLRCAFCGQPYPDGTPDHKSEALAEHIQQCPEHPVGKENRALRAEVERLRSVLCCQGRRDPVSAQAGTPFDEDLSLKHRMEAGHA